MKNIKKLPSYVANPKIQAIATVVQKGGAKKLNRKK